MGYTPENNPYIPGDPYSYDLKWIVQQLKKAIDLYTPLSTEFKDLKEYVEHYFDDLDLSETVAAELEKMKDDGTLSDLISQFIPWQSVVERSEIYATTSYYVYCVETDCWYSRHKNNYTGEYEYLDGGIHRADGTTVFPRALSSVPPATSTPDYNISECIASWMQATSLVAGSDHTLYDPVVGNEIDCATFVNAVLNGTTYELSRYVLGGSVENLLGNYAGDNPPIKAGFDERKSLRTWQMAEWYAEHKQLYEIPKSPECINVLRFGDVLFSSAYDQDLVGSNARYYGIDHVLIVLETYPNDGAILCAQAGGAGVPTITHIHDTGVMRLTLISFANNIGENYQVFARPSYGSGASGGVDILNWIEYEGAVAATGNDNDKLASAYLRKPLSPNKLYSITLRGDLPSYDTDGCWIYVRARTANLSDDYNFMRGYKLASNEKELTLIGCLDGSDPVRFLDINCNTTEKIGTPVFEIKEVEIAEGIVMGGNGDQPLEFTLADTTNFEVVYNQSRITKQGIIIDMSLNKITSATGDFTLGTFSGMPWLPREISLPVTMGNVNLSVLRISNTAVLFSTTLASTSTMVVRQIIA